MKTRELVPVVKAAHALRITRERLIRQVQTGQIDGEQRDGRWFVYQDALDRARGSAKGAGWQSSESTA